MPYKNQNESRRLRYENDPRYRERIKLAAITWQQMNPHKLKVMYHEKYLRVRDIQLEYQREFRRLHPEIIRDRNLRYAQRVAEHREKHRNEINAKARKRSKLLREQFPDLAAAIKAASNHRRRQRKFHGIPATEDEKKSAAAMVNTIKRSILIVCRWCGADVPKHLREVDHIIPLSRGGRDVGENLCCACRSCNRSKGARLPTEFQPHPTARVLDGPRRESHSGG